MDHGFRPHRARWLIMVALFVLLAGLVSPVAGAPPTTRTLVPIGSDYSDATLQRFAAAAAHRDTSGTVYMLILPITYATDPFSISDEEREENLALADTRRGQVEAACNVVKQPAQTCRAVLAPILVREDAYRQSNLDLFTRDLDGIYILGGDQTIAMRVVADTPTERRMAGAYRAGVVVGGNSAGAAVESLTMIAGYVGDNGPENGLQQGSVDLWLSEGRSDHERGLIFGISNALLDQHTYQRGRIGRLLNATWTTGLLGIGADAETAVVISNERLLHDVTGSTSAIVIDTKTYRATGRYTGPTDSLAVHRVATHLIPPGDYGYDIARLRPLVDGQPLPAPDLEGRSFDSLRLPDGYGTLFLGGDISGDKAGPVADRFVKRSGGRGARLVVLATGYAESADAQADATAYAEAFQANVDAPVQSFVLDAGADQTTIRQAIAGATGIFLTAPDQSRVRAAFGDAATTIRAIRQAWHRGATLMADNAAAAAIGQTMTVDATPTDDSLEDDSIGDFLVDSVDVRAGRAFIANVAIEPRLLPDRHWGRLYNLIYRDPELLAVGVDAGTALEVTQAKAVVRGTSAVVTLDGRCATFAVGSNGALGARWVVLDSYVAGDAVKP